MIKLEKKYEWKEREERRNILLKGLKKEGGEPKGESERGVEETRDRDKNEIRK